MSHSINLFELIGVASIS